MACSSCAKAAAARKAAQSSQSAGTSGAYFLVMPNGAKEAFPTELAAREENRRRGGRGLVRKA